MAGHVKVRSERERTRLRRKVTIRKRVSGTAERPRLSVFRSSKHIYAQAVDDTSGKVLAAASDLEQALKAELEGKTKKERARVVGKALGAKLLAQQVSSVVFDRNGFLYHGRVAEVADGAREAGLAF
ncbi:MAG: 50S ribosomal protein L18 [Kofleriaceae bacterium]|nr:50S ribosomal protein L18 [Kofleriaceae bacterium]MCL4223483.1 50S ribosomal protein L18 [Myxococcales bacterium]